MTYTEKDLMQIGARYHNAKRNYLLINPIQGKHIPCSPTACLDMYHALGNQLKKKYPDTKLVIGFAETATAIGAGIASLFEDCVYIHTTRETCVRESGASIIEFEEEHSHAVEQMLIGGDMLQGYLNGTDTVIFVDDELTTGKTIRNVMAQLKDAYPCLQSKTIIAASVINRMSDADLAIMSQNGITCEALLKMDNINYTDIVNKMLPHIQAASNIGLLSGQVVWNIKSPLKKLDPRFGARSGEYDKWCYDNAEFLVSIIGNELNTNHIDVIGTEECMYPAIILGSVLEKDYRVTTHSTTRSPIGIINDKNYPVQNGYALPSFYDPTRATFLYNIKKHKNGTLIIVTDTTIENGPAERMLSQIYTSKGYSRIIVFTI